MTLDEVEAFNRGYTVGFAAGMKAADEANEARLEKRAREVTAPGHRGFMECTKANADVMCSGCDCWKMFREYCS